jgi:hypothetical protein
MKRTELNLAERRTIENLLHLKVNVTEIARQINRHRSTVDLSRYRAAPITHLCGLSFESQGTFPAEC